jgi:transposase InsO family protein
VERYEMIAKMNAQPACPYSTAELCATLAVSPSGFYAHWHKTRSERRRQDAQLAEQIGVLFLQSRGTYGCRRIRHGLRRQAVPCGTNRVRRLMRQRGLHARQKRRFRPRTTQSRHDQPIAPNRLATLTEPPQQPNQVWAADLTYVPTLEEGWCYLALELDQCSRRVAGWSLGDSLAVPLVRDAFERAVQAWAVAPALHHSDRGCQYASSEFRTLLSRHRTLPSMSRTACPYDNAVMESFFATLKTECFGDRVPRNRAEAQSLLFDYIETFYNPKRFHSALGYLSPLEFETHLAPATNPTN